MSTLEEKSFIEKVGIYAMALPLGAIVFVPLIIWRGWALSYLWNWFAVPIFHATMINIPQAIAVCLLVGFLRGNVMTEGGSKWFFYVVFNPPLAVLVGWVLRGWV